MCDTCAAIGQRLPFPLGQVNRVAKDGPRSGQTEPFINGQIIRIARAEYTTLLAAKGEKDSN